MYCFAPELIGLPFSLFGKSPVAKGSFSPGRAFCHVTPLAFPADGMSSCVLQFIVFPQASKTHVVTELWADPQAGVVTGCTGADVHFGCILE